MAPVNLLAPISEEDPCGPDLEREDDPDFVDYYFEAEARMPERYFTPGTAEDGSDDRLFDPRSVDLGKEKAVIDRLLARSRDLRLMGLLARFQILAGRLGDFADTVEDMAAMMGQWPEEVHPQVDRGAGERRAAIEALNSQPAVVMPLLHLSLVSNGEVTLRRHMVAGGKAEARKSEGDIAGSDLLGPLRSEANQRSVTNVNDQLTRVADALHRMGGLAASHPVRTFTPDLGAVRAAIADMQGMIASVRPDLRPWSASAAAMAAVDATEDAAEAAVEDSAPTGQPSAPPKAKAGTVPTIPNRATAAAALDAAKTWLAGHEPSSPALVLVTQARLLVGAPLVEAIEVLMPTQAGNVVLHIGQGSSFSLPMARLKELTTSGLEQDQQASGQATALPTITRRGDLIGHLLGVEGYFAAQEPASPIPLLLVKAREMLEKRFDAIMAELLVATVQDG
ncbi:ImpA family type VI secretion system protein [Paracoccus saliphilus]|uniref:Type VI secretion system ImpA family N-terminal domain-containing protein n=1 Tax=Paracoccus saliphilus TaxID=405559 RepID=A0AA46A480_9RHOB|nr:type VI secretion system ImpA family N-terminal domain-containing protein [Paracoccus saliphilus]WCR03638.1 type VI secretion system ImpA family N-terminal domain-containing protein [Paracoccus saliphilus]SIS57086.1 type VI secretion system protein ImpA [Paracoccus saliphilus]